MRVTSTTSPAQPTHQAERPYSPETGFVHKLLLRFVPFFKSTLWRRVSSGLFPPRFACRSGITAWRAEDVRRWIARAELNGRCVPAAGRCASATFIA